MFEVVCVIRAKSLSDIDVLIRSLSKGTRPEFNDDLPEELMWLFDVVDLIPEIESFKISRSKDKVLLIWNNEYFDINAFCMELTKNQYRVLGYFYRHYEDVGGEDDPLPNGLSYIYKERGFKEVVLPQTEGQNLSTREIIEEILKLTSF